MLAIELVKILLGMSAFFLGIFGLTWLFVEKVVDDEIDNIPNTLLTLAAIMLLILFHI